MRKVKYVHSDPSVDEMFYDQLTDGKVYDVIRYDHELRYDDSVTILNDLGDRDTFFIYSNEGILEFIDVTTEYRDEVINNILLAAPL